jgi:hypothetical protein
MKIRIEKKEKKQRCRFWAGRYTGTGLMLYCKDKDGVRAYSISKDNVLAIRKHMKNDTWELVFLASEYEPMRSPGPVVAEFATEKDAAIALKRAFNAIRSMRVPSRAWIYWLIAAIFIVGVLVSSTFSAGVINKGAATTVGKSQAATAFQQSPSNPNQFAPPSPVAPVEPPSSIDLSALPPDNHAWGFGNPKGKPVYVFSDPTCHYCGELDRALKAIGKDYYVHLYPTPVRGRDAVALVANFACSPNPQAAWSDWMENGKFNEKVEIKPECSSPALAVANSNIGIMKTLGFKGVPVIIRADGAAINGSMTTDELGAWLSQSSK